MRFYGCAAPSTSLVVSCEIVHESDVTGALRHRPSRERKAALLHVQGYLVVVVLLALVHDVLSTCLGVIRRYVAAVVIIVSLCGCAMCPTVIEVLSFFVLAWM